MRRITLFLLLVIFFSGLHAQHSAWSVSVEAGAAIPVGKFGSKNINDSTASFAKIGPALNISLDYKLAKNFGFSFLLSGQQNDVDTKSLDQKLHAAFPQTEFSSQSSNWLIGKIMAGVNTSIPLDQKNRFTLTARILAGILKTSAYKFDQHQLTNGSDSLLGGGTIESEYSAKLTLKWAFSYLAGIGLQYNLTDQVSLKTNFDYSAASMKFPRGNYTGSGTLSGGTGAPPATITSYPKQPIASVNWCVGLEVNL